MNFSDPGILHRGAVEQYPDTIYMARVNGRLYHMPWCPTCCFHRLPRTFHCERCDICVEELDHHCRWVNNCVGHRNIRLYLLLLVSLCLYLGTVLATCVVFIIRRRHMAFLDKTMTILVAVPAGALLVPLILQFFIKAVAVGTARRPYEEKYDRGFNEGCPKNCYIALCAPLGPKYMSEAVCIQVDQGNKWGPKEHLKDLLWPRCATQAPPRSGKSAPVQKGMPEQQAQLPQTFRVLKGKPTEFPLAVRGVNKYYNASTLKQKKLRLTTPGDTSDSEKDCFPSGTPALNTKGPETSAIVMEEDDGNGEVRPFTAPGHGHTRPGMPEQQAQLPQTFRVLKGKPTEFPLAVRGVNKYYNASTLKQKKLRLTTPEKDCFPSGTPALNTKGPETSAIVMEEDDGNGEVHPFTAPGHGHTRPGMPEQRAQLPQTFRVLKGKPTEHPLAVRGVNKYYNANTLKQKNLRLTTPEKDCFPSGTPALNTKGPETSAIVMEEDDGNGEVRPFTAPGHGHTRPGMPEQQAQLPQTFRVLKGKPTEFPLAVRGVNKYYNASTLKQKKLRLTTPEKDCFPSGTPALNTKGPETSAIVMEEDDGNGEVHPFTAPGHGHTRPGMPEHRAQLPQTFRVLKGKPTEHPLAVRGVNKYYNANTLKQKNLRLTTPEKDCFPSGTPALNTKGPETSAIVMEEDDGDGEVRPFTAPRHGHTRPRPLPNMAKQLTS
uniref:uncharacterized protein LOC143408295 isoform X4 n=1 Tax=Callospermophilus lateralis TaxID=76772 RepID=UPI00403888C3